MTNCPKCHAADSQPLSTSPQIVRGRWTDAAGETHEAVAITYRRCERCRQTFTCRRPVAPEAPAAAPEAPARPRRRRRR